MTPSTSIDEKQNSQGRRVVSNNNNIGFSQLNVSTESDVVFSGPESGIASSEEVTETDCSPTNSSKESSLLVNDIAPPSIRKRKSTFTHVEAVNPIRRMSLKEFTGLDHTKEDIRNLPAPSWKHSTSPTSLINSYSARRRSVLATDMPSSPSKKLAPPKEECMDLSAAISGVSALQSRLREINSTQKSSSSSSSSAIVDSNHDRQELLEETRRIVNATKDFAAISCSMPEAKWNAVVAEITDSADCLTTKALTVVSESNVYYSQLVATELAQVLTAIHNALSDAQQSRLQHDDSLMLKSMTNLQSATNQLFYAVLSKTTS